MPFLRLLRSEDDQCWILRLRPWNSVITSSAVRSVYTWINPRILKKCDNLNHNLLFLVPDQTTTPESDIPANFNNGIPWDHCTYWVFLSLFDRKHKKGTTYVHCTLFSYILLCYLMHSTRTHCAFSSNSFHRQITQNISANWPRKQKMYRLLGSANTGRCQVKLGLG